MREPDNPAVVMFDHGVDKDFWFRDDELAAEMAKENGYADDDRWFEAGNYDDGPIAWTAVLNSCPDSTPILLVRAS